MCWLDNESLNANSVSLNTSSETLTNDQLCFLADSLIRLLFFSDVNTDSRVFFYVYLRSDIQV
jgi:hypothetical protein